MTQQGTLFDQAAGEAAREEGLDQVEGHNETFMEIMRRVAIAHAQTFGTVTSDDLREYAHVNGIVPDSCNAWGAIFRGHIWVVHGYCNSRIPSNHARTIKIWSLRRRNEPHAE